MSSFRFDCVFYYVRDMDRAVVFYTDGASIVAQLTGIVGIGVFTIVASTIVWLRGPMRCTSSQLIPMPKPTSSTSPRRAVTTAAMVSRSAVMFLSGTDTTRAPSSSRGV